MSRIINAAWKNDLLFTPNRLKAGDRETFSIICEGGLPASVATIPIVALDHPDKPLVIAGICEIRGKRTVIFRQPDTTGPKTVAEKTLETHCERAGCLTKGCALLRERKDASDARKRSKRKRATHGYKRMVY